MCVLVNNLGGQIVAHRNRFITCYETTVEIYCTSLLRYTQASEKQEHKATKEERAAKYLSRERQRRLT